jgi:hypothetical protein
MNIKIMAYYIIRVGSSQLSYEQNRVCLCVCVCVCADKMALSVAYYRILTLSPAASLSPGCSNCR